MGSMQFFGVRTAGSLAFRLFPQWAAVLGIQDAALQGVDLPLRGPLEPHRAAVQALKSDPALLGALITAHKIRVVRAAGDLIDQYTPQARLCGEVSALYKRGGQLCGDACDPSNSGRAMAHFLGPDYWRMHAGATILSLGGGGAAVALMYHLLTEARWQPRRLTIVDIRQENLAHCRAVAEMLCAAGMSITYELSRSPRDNDALVASLPPRSLVINATGMGKDLPGSPVTDAAVFPEGGAVWELNYRGERPFLQQALAQQRSRALKVTDGWHYFMHGWSSVIGHVYDVPVTPEIFAAFCDASEAGRHAIPVSSTEQ